jgi:hypothetical protein
MLELNLRSGQVVAFDGRVLEVFADGDASRRFHVAQLEGADPVEAVDGARVLSLDDGTAVAFAPEEAPACARLGAAISEARTALDR